MSAESMNKPSKKAETEAPSVEAPKEPVESSPQSSRGNDRYFALAQLSEMRCGELWSGIDGRRGGDVSLFYPHLKEGAKPEAVQSALAKGFKQASPLRDTDYKTVRDAAFDSEGRLFLVIDRPEGQPLFSLLREHKTLDLDLALSLIIQLCELLKRAHDAELFTSNITLHTLVVAPRPNGALQLSLIDLSLDRRPLSTAVASPPRELMSPPHAALTQERDRRLYAIYLCSALLHHLVFGVAPEAPVLEGEERVWPALPQKGRQLDRRLEACLHTVLMKGLSVTPAARFPLVGALQRTLIGLRQLSSVSSPAFELLASTQRRLGQGRGSFNLAAPRPGVKRAVEARERIHKILVGESSTLEDILESEGGSLIR